ncbi:MAG: MBL fold metallo-hydrolase [Hyphomicrobiaceae bacterium]|nr:MBL fold metallo-hydrolase [Hyphomicrobiaceae bacterium]
MIAAARRVCTGLVALSLVCTALLGVASAAEDRCIAVANAPGNRLLHKASVRPAQAEEQGVRITYVGHSTFLIESRKGVRIATDYSDWVRPAVVPDIITMNRAHSSHFTETPDPRIPHVLRGWNPAGGPAVHDLTERDVRVRNIPTNIRSWGTGGTDEFGNSIFIFEMGTLCIAHLGHLHHTLSDRQIGQIGQMDVILAPVDGSYTLDTPGMIEVLKGLKAPLVIPMHYFSSFTLSRFLDVARADFEVATSPTPSLTVSRATLPSKPQILVLPGS